MEGTYVKNLICKVIDKSESNNWDNAVMESQFKLLHAVEEGKFLSLSVELFSRKLLLWLYEEGAIYSRWWRRRG